MSKARLISTSAQKMGQRSAMFTCSEVAYLSQARQVGGVGNIFAFVCIAAMLCLLCNRGPGGGFETAQVHHPPWGHHVLGTHICQGALLKPVANQEGF